MQTLVHDTSLRVVRRGLSPGTCAIGPLAIATVPMSSPNIRQSFQTNPQCADVGTALKNTTIKVIHLNHEENDTWSKTSFWQECLAEGIQISYVEHPCRLHKVKSTSEVIIAEQEIRHAFTPHFWQRVQKEPVAAAICVSHARALHESLSQNPAATCIIVLEGDVETTPNTNQLLAAFLANWHGNTELENTQYVALTFSDWHAGYSKKVHDQPGVLPSTRVPPYFQLASLPRHPQQQSGREGYHFIGQGARAIAYSPEFARKVLDAKFNSYYDLHLLELLAKEAGLWRKSTHDILTLALLAMPPLFTHVPSFEARFRGSGRLQSEAQTPAEETSYFLCLDLSHQWGLSNRVQTIILWIIFCSYHRLGLYICWEPLKACNTLFSEILSIDVTQAPLHSIPFCRVLDSRKTSWWNAARNNQHWCYGTIESQCTVSMGLQFMFQEYEQLMKKSVCKDLISTVLPIWKEASGDLQQYWNAMSVKPEIIDRAKGYISGAMGDATHAIGVHVRRGDYKGFNFQEKLTDPNISEEKKGELETTWEYADQIVEEHHAFEMTCMFSAISTTPRLWHATCALLISQNACILRCLHDEATLIDLFNMDSATVFLFTDDPQYRQHYQETYSWAVDEGKLHFGPVDHSTIGDTGAEWTTGIHFQRDTSVEDALLEFCVLGLCHEFYGTTGSTVTFMVEWLANKYGTGFVHMMSIGEFDMPTKPTMNFRHQTKDLISKVANHLMDPGSYNINNEQANVLNFLAPNHLKEMYDIIVAALMTTPKQTMAASTLCKDHLLSKSRVARLNRDKFNDAGGGAKYQHWFKALIRYRLMQHTLAENPTGNIIEINEENQVFLTTRSSHMFGQMPATTGGTGSSAASSSDQAPPWRTSLKRKLGN